VEPRVLPGPKDMTEAFEVLHALVKEQGPGNLAKVALRRMPNERGNRKFAWSPGKFLWTPGIFASHMGNHSKHLLERVAQMGLEVVPVPVDTDVATDENIELIKQYIRSSGEGEVILAGHSRGGIMNLDAYRQLSEQDKAKVAQIIVVQSPINGSHIADWVVKSRLLRFVAAVGTKLLWGKNALPSVLELSSAGRKTASRRLPPLTDADLAKIITLRSIIKKGDSPSFEIPRLLAARAGHESDGLTPYTPSEIRGARDVTLRAYDHENLVVQKPGIFKWLQGYRGNKRYQAGDVIEALVLTTFVPPELIDQQGEI